MPAPSLYPLYQGCRSQLFRLYTAQMVLAVCAEIEHGAACPQREYLSLIFLIVTDATSGPVGALNLTQLRLLLHGWLTEPGEAGLCMDTCNNGSELMRDGPSPELDFL